jgi:microcystin-dependent protein
MSTSSTHGLEGPVGTDIAGTEIPKAYVTNNPLLDSAAGHFYAIGPIGSEVVEISMGAVYNYATAQWNAHSGTTVARRWRFNADASVDTLYWTGVAGAQNIGAAFVVQASITPQGLFPGMPTGALTQYAGTTAPAGWLLCDGSAVSRATYGALFGVVGTTYGAGDGSSTFNVPDLRSRAPIGAGQGSGLSNRVLGTSGGEETHLLVTAEMPAHSHPITDPGHNHAASDGSNPANIANNTGSNYKTGGSQGGIVTLSSATTGITEGNTGGGGTHNNMQPWVAVNFLIKT